MRYVIEGEWSGYRSNQQRVCHREVIKYNPKNSYSKIDCIQFTDGTTMSITVRHCKPRERVQEIHGYDSLLNKCIAQGKTGFITVESLYERKSS